MNEEIWKPIKGYEKLYEVSSYGRMRSFQKSTNGEIMKLCKNLRGYCYVHVYKDKKRSAKLISRLVAQAFLDDYSEFMEVDHIDGDKLNNELSNLRMVSSSENSKGYQNKRKNCSSAYRGVCWIKSRRRWRVSLQPKDRKPVVREFKNEAEAAAEYNRIAVELGFPLEALNVIESNGLQS